jgi:DDE superfamily endonuclease
MASYHAPREWEEWIDWLAAGLHGRSRWRLPVLMLGAVFAGGRRVVASWIRAAGVSHDFQDFYFFLKSVGRRWQEPGLRLLVLLLPILKDQRRVLLAIDDSPTKRYGPKVQGAGIHHDPTPGPSGNAFCYGHVWVTLAVIVRHQAWGAIGLPIFAWLYVRKQDVPKIPKRYRWTFQTKLEQAADLVLRAAKLLQHHGKTVWCVADGAYAKRPFVQPLLKQGATLVGRLRKDSALFDLPAVEKVKRRGRKRVYGKNRISLTSVWEEPHFSDECMGRTAFL